MFKHTSQLTLLQNRDDLETAEFFLWPKLFWGYKAVKSVPVTYSYKPVTYTAYKWVPVPYEASEAAH